MKIAVIADDLTGANNTGVRLKKQGFSAATVMHGSASPPDGYDAICVDTDSRYVSADEARERVVRAATSMRRHGAKLLCKRIDTLLRGNVGAEIDAILGACAPGAVAVVSAAFPDSNRVVKGGHLLIDGVPVNRNAVAAGDPISPVRYSYVPDIIAEQSGERVAVLDLNVVVQGAKAVAAQLSKLADGGARVVVVDAVSAEHVETLAQAMATLERPLVPVDPGALTAAYARPLFGGAGRGEKILVSVGSTSALTCEQLAYALEKWEIEATCVRADLLAGEADKRDLEIEKAVLAALKQLKQGMLAVVTTLHAAGPVNLQMLAHAEGSTPQLLAKRIADGLAEVSCEVLRRSGGAVGACYSTGGDVTAAFYRRAGSSGFELIDEVMPLVAHMRLLGGGFEGLLMVTKGGSVGTRTTLSDCVSFLFEKVGSPVQKP